MLLIDDEAPARQLLQEYLADYPDLIIVGEANNGVDALRMIRELEPEIVFLDVQMPGLNGLEVIARLDVLPLIIFSTAYDRYALEAFELHAVDYLLKPYTKDRFGTAVRKLLSRLAEPQENLRSLAQQIVDDAGAGYPSKILVPKGNRLIAINVDDIIRVGAEGDYSQLVTKQQSFLSQNGLGYLEKRLPPDRFLRVHRSSIININAVQEIFKEGHGYDIRLQNGDLVRVSRSYAPKVKDLIL